MRGSRDAPSAHFTPHFWRTPAVVGYHIRVSGHSTIPGSPMVPRRSSQTLSDIAFVSLFVGSVALFGTSTAENDGKPKRVPWTTSRVVGTPEPPPKYKAPVAFPNLKLKNPLLMARLPDSN